MESKICLQCGAPIQGRADKKFCDDYCRNVYNNQSKRGSINLIRNITNALRRNRNILETLMNGEDTYKTPREKLTESGFNFKYHTHTYTNKRGDVYFYCFDHGYLPLENDWFLLVRKKEKKVEQD
ncbi:hypothetical protein GCM10011506_07680 [Marivirga lumbricoides]|uniref:DUF2116 family Zn-ribbon domain-containing protein n=1 Tax=Marivirga lumbricoides TaxID=1046115 RepID=A0A2T4DCZ6_9BACT|nr:hypothetical protein C9994_15060 [Marivirga lumbricoides]GGC24848.1 hypothetical protein GCM10011506_07680 [Marivirga lumbricoides]